MTSKVCYAVCSNLDQAADSINKGLYRFAKSLWWWVYAAIVVVMTIIEIIHHDRSANVIVISEGIVTTFVLFIGWILCRKVVKYCLIKHAPKVAQDARA